MFDRVRRIWKARRPAPPIRILALAIVSIATAPAQTSAPPDDSASDQPFVKPATIDNGLEVVGDKVAAKEINTRIAVGVFIDGAGPFQFFVDSGADRSVIGETLAARLGLPPGRPVILHSTGGTRSAATVRLSTLRVGSSLIRDIAAPALSEQFLGGDGLLGIDALVDQRLTIDFEARTVVVQDTHRPEHAAGPDEVIVTARRRKGQLILTQADAGIPIAAVIDTGTEITIGNSALRARLLHQGRRPAMVGTVISVAGDSVPVDLLVVPEIRIGDLTLRNVLVAFSDVPPFALFGLASKPAILLGNDILSGFRRVSLDFRRRKVRFVLRRDT
jgi:predicted aspartyl protease